jgi:hypothetical protein
VPQAPSPAEIAAREARDLNQKGIDTYNSGSYETAATFFQEALDKLPGDSTIHQNLQAAKDQIAAKQRKSKEEFEQDKARALSQLKGIAATGNLGSDPGLKGVASPFLGLKDIRTIGASVGLKTPPDVHTDAHVVDSRNMPTWLQESGNLTIIREIAGIQNALRRLTKSMNLDAVQREEWEQESKRATRDAWILAGSATLDLLGAHVDYQLETADSELKHSVDLLSNTIEPNRREQLGIAFKVLKDRKDELKRLRSSIAESQESYGGTDLASKIVESRDSKIEVALEAIWKAGERLKVISPSASAAKTLVAASYLIAVQAASMQRISAFNGNSAQYLAAVKVLKARMETLMRGFRQARKAQRPRE